MTTIDASTTKTPAQLASSAARAIADLREAVEALESGAEAHLRDTYHVLGHLTALAAALPTGVSESARYIADLARGGELVGRDGSDVAECQSDLDDVLLDINAASRLLHTALSRAQDIVGNVSAT
ncbi:hypothetical protein [Streptomyces sp. NRRL S-241]|uniref:hypothetical protein n=1 Tax=Streptomyces sp. NRRL S-241 TaxID=1463896 RepID=UPI0004C13D92|nr:hypothetical protein [Streptomyces sp. NRRL S-241]